MPTSNRHVFWSREHVLTTPRANDVFTAKISDEEVAAVDQDKQSGYTRNYFYNVDAAKSKDEKVTKL